VPNPIVVSVLVDMKARGKEVASATSDSLTKIETTAQRAGAAMASTNIVLNGNRSVVGQATAQTKLHAHEVTNLTYQLNDMATMMASGQSPFMMMMQQGPQVSQILGSRGLGQILPALGQGLMSLVTPTNLFLAGILAVGYAGAAVYRALVPAVEPLSNVLDKQKKLLDDLKISWGEASQEAQKYGRDTTDSLSFGLERSEFALTKRLRQETEGRSFGRAGTINSVFKTAFDDNKSQITGDPNFPVSSRFLAPLRKDLEAAIKATAEGKPAIIGFIQSLEQMGERTQNSGIKAMVNDIIAGLEPLEQMSRLLIEAKRRRDELTNSVDPNGRLRPFGKLAQDDLGNFALYNSQEAQLRKRMLEQQSLSVTEMLARSPQDRAASARAQAGADVVDGESAATRSLRIELAGTIALAKANHDLAEAQRGRLIALKDTMATAELDLKLIGQSASEVARLKLEYQLTGAVRAAAAEAGIDADEAELALIRQKAAAYADLKTVSDARGFIQSKTEELAKLRLEQQLIGTTTSIRARALASYEAELDIRKRGLDTAGAEANQIRARAPALASVTSELERQRDAWGKVQSAGESALDLLVDGNFDGALKEVSKTLLDIAVKNPLKNALLGTQNGTLQDLGGFTGLLSKLFGGANDNASGAISSALGASAVSAMNVTAASVVINGGLGGSAGGLLNSLLGGAANSNYAPGAITKSALPPLSSMLAYRNAIKSIESDGSGGYGALGPLTAKGDRAFGAYQVMGANIPSWTKQALGQTLTPDQFLKNQGAQDSVFDHFFGKSVSKFGNPQDAASVWFTGRPLKSGAGAQDVLGTSGSEYVDKFTKALETSSEGVTESFTKLNANSNVASNGLSTMASGLDGMGNGLTKLGNNLAQSSPASGGGGGLSGFFSSLFGGGGGGGGGGGFSSVFTDIIAAGGDGLFSEGGDVFGAGTETSDSINAWLSNGEFVVKTRQAQKYRPLLHAINNDTFRGYAEGGTVSRFGYSSAGYTNNSNGRAANSIQFINNGTPQRVTEEREEDDGRGGRKTVYVLEDMIANTLRRPGSPARRALGSDFGISGKVKQR
jgi:hypothetical protein